MRLEVLGKFKNNKLPHRDLNPGPQAFQFSGYRGDRPTRVERQDVKLAFHLHVVSTSRLVELYLHSPIRLHRTVLKYLSTGTALRLEEI
jgi:hypothetical protein